MHLVFLRVVVMIFATIHHGLPSPDMLVVTTRLFLYLQADIDLCTENGTTALFIACRRGHLQVVSTLLVSRVHVEHTLRRHFTLSVVYSKV